MARMRGVRTNPLRLAIFMALLGGIMAALLLARGELVVGQHEGDALHLTDMVLRMTEVGQRPHFDFMTPIGILSLLPIAAFVKAGYGMGMAFLAAQVAVAAVLFLPILRVAVSRFSGLYAWGFAAYALVMALSMAYGEGYPAISVSMHYNRWAWALAYIAIPLAMLEPLGPRRPLIDGALIGLALAGMALIKVTYFAAFFPAILIALLIRRDWGGLLVGLVAGLAVVGAVTGVYGIAFWLAYLNDLLTVANSTTRSAPGLPLADIVFATKHISGTILLLLTVILLRQAGEMVAGLVLLLLVPGFIYVTYQNYGNDPQWLVLLALLALGLRPEGGQTNGFGWRLDSALLVSGTFALALGASSAINMVWSPVRHYFAQYGELVPFFANLPQHHDLLGVKRRVERVPMKQVGGEQFETFASYTLSPEEADTPAEVNGEMFRQCEITGGYNVWFETTVKSLEEAGYGGDSIFVADLFSALWLYGDFTPIRGAAPWYYGGTPGLEAAEHVLVPSCPTSEKRRAEILEQIAEEGWSLSEEMRTETYVLYRPSKS